MNQTPFSQHVAHMSKGSVDTDLTETLADLVKAVRLTGKQGSVSLKLKVGMLNRADEDTVKITPVVTSSMPELDLPEAIMWSTGDGDLLRTDPSQQKAQLETVTPDTRETLKVAEGSEKVHRIGV